MARIAARAGRGGAQRRRRRVRAALRGCRSPGPGWEQSKGVTHASRTYDHHVFGGRRRGGCGLVLRGARGRAVLPQGFNGALAYVEFRIGDYSHELGILDRRYVGPTPENQGGTVAYWAVDDVQAAHDRLIEHGATPHQPVTEQGPGFVTASVIDPFGNPLGVMFNQHYLDVLAQRG